MVVQITIAQTIGAAESNTILVDMSLDQTVDQNLRQNRVQR